MDPNSTKKWSKKKLVLFSFVTILIFFLFIEILFRIFFWIQWSPYNTSLSIQGSPRLVDDSAMVWNNRPFYLEYYKESQYNELGMRVNAADVRMPVKKENDFWVFLLGGSAMAGMGSNINGEWLDITNVFTHTISTSIDGYLQEILQRQMPDKKVRVFNAAVSSATILQSRWNYKRLKKYKPDWVVSMDGVNEPKAWTFKGSLKDHIHREWRNDPQNNFPISFYTAITQHSAFFNFLKKWWFFKRLEIRRAANKNGGSAIRKNWIDQDPGKKMLANDKRISAAVDSFLYHLLLFEKDLESDKQKHLLLIQPHLSMRNTSKLLNSEQAVFNYYCSLGYMDTNTYFEMLYKKARDMQLNSMENVHDWNFEVFVDYCHFTSRANEQIAMDIATAITDN